MNLMPKVTIAIPTYNRVDFLNQALDSALSQTYLNVEVVVSNNASTDHTEKLLSTYCDKRLIVMHQSSNIGMMGNWDACLSSATGDFFLLLSDDDVLDRNAISELIVEFINEKPDNVGQSGGYSINEEVGMVWCRSKIINERNEVLRYSAKAPRIENTFSVISGFFNGKRETYPCSILLRTLDIRQWGGYKASELTLIADAYVWIGCCLNRKEVRYIETCLTNYRVHTGSETTNATIDEWLYNNSKLARLCINYYQISGEHLYSSLLEERIDALNVQVIISLLIKKIWSNELTLFCAISQYFFLCRKYHIKHCAWRFLKESIVKLGYLVKRTKFV